MIWFDGDFQYDLSSFRTIQKPLKVYLNKLPTKFLVSIKPLFDGVVLENQQKTSMGSFC
jgi:hypothetical protein